jgi:hypothetical protein
MSQPNYSLVEAIVDNITNKYLLQLILEYEDHEKWMLSMCKFHEHCLQKFGQYHLGVSLEEQEEYPKYLSNVVDAFISLHRFHKCRKLENTSETLECFCHYAASIRQNDSIKRCKCRSLMN